MKILKRIVLLLLTLVVLLGIGGLFLPASTHVERTTMINASPAQIFPWLNEMDRFNEWSPWVEMDPDAQYELEGPMVGVGAKMRWTGEKSGSGTQEIIESVKYERVRIKLDFGSEGTAISYYELDDDEGGTSVTWGFDSDHGYNVLNRYFGLMLDKWVGAEYEKGLLSLKQLVELIASQELAQPDVSEPEGEAESTQDAAPSSEAAELMENETANQG